MAENHTTHESLAESPLNSAVSGSDLLAELELEEMVTRTMINLQKMIHQTEFPNDFGEAGAFLDNDFSGELTADSSNSKPWCHMAANHTTHESLAESPLNFAVSEGDLSVKLKVEEMVMRTMIMLQEMMQRTESQNELKRSIRMRP